MHLISYLSDFMIPMLIFYVAACGLAEQVPVYDTFVKGATKGGKNVVKILPTLVGLMVAVGMGSCAGAAGSTGISPPFLGLCGHFSCFGPL